MNKRTFPAHITATLAVGATATAPYYDVNIKGGHNADYLWSESIHQNAHYTHYGHAHKDGYIGKAAC